jgi:hypothetical protein
MSALVWLLILLGPFLAVAPLVVVVAPQIPGFWGRWPSDWERPRTAAAGWAVASWA